MTTPEDAGPNDDGVQLELVMPFVIVQSQGGPFDDDAFVAGVTCGHLDHELMVAAALGGLPGVRYIDARLLPQVDLIAMRHGYVLELGHLDDASGWQAVQFTLA
ncbi:hypothetical protein [Streptomyces sp. NPDC005407]|uniref:hypothetical protein n=1 Tax=Streptomyces sp. NPDC005407 TaxID=3155340 RepID=UPI0033BC2EBB